MLSRASISFIQMPQLKPETISMTGLNLFQHLCNLARLATSAYDGGSNSEVRKIAFVIFSMIFKKEF